MTAPRDLAARRGRVSELVWQLPAPSARQLWALSVLTWGVGLVGLIWWASLCLDVISGRAHPASAPVGLTLLALWALNARVIRRQASEARPIDLQWCGTQRDTPAGWYGMDGIPARLNVLADVGPWLLLECRCAGRIHRRLVSARGLSTPIRWRLFHGSRQPVASSAENLTKTNHLPQLKSSSPASSASADRSPQSRPRRRA